MYIYVDESGTFTANAKVPTDSWCVVVAYASPESDLERLDALVSSLRAERGGGVEVKLHQVGEARYVRFLRDLSRLNGLMFAVSVDVSLHSLDGVQAHQLAQADKVIENREKMIHATVREQLTVLRGEILDLPAQLYTQLICQIELFHKVLQRAPLYFSQHKPETLASFKWRIDQKDTIPTTYETAFRTILPSLLQTKSFRDPMVSLIEGNNEYLKRFEFPEGQYPTYLDEHYGVKSKGQGLNVGQMAQEDFQLVDSSAVSGYASGDLTLNWRS